MPYQPPLSTRIASEDPEERMKILAASSVLGAKVRVGGAHGRGLDGLRVRQRDRGAGHPRAGLGAALSAALGVVGAGGRGARQGQGRGRGRHCGEREEDGASGA